MKPFRYDFTNAASMLGLHRRYLVKMIRQTELKVLLSILGSYQQHIASQQGSLLTRFLGAYTVRLSHSRVDLSFVVMNNVVEDPPRADGPRDGGSIDCLENLIPLNFGLLCHPALCSPIALLPH